MSYAKILPVQTVLDIIPVSDGEVPEHINLGAIITNYPEVGEDWMPYYSVDAYIDLAGVHTSIPPEYVVALADSQYIWKYVHHYFGVSKPS